MPGVETESGERFMARDAVVSTIHVKHLLDMAPREVWGEDFEYGVDTFDVGVPCSATYLATTGRPSSTRPPGRGARSRRAWPAGREDVVQYSRDLRDGKW